MFDSAIAARVEPDGLYEFNALPPSEYTLTVGSGVDGRHWFAAARVELAGADMVVPLTLRGPASLRGRYVFDGAGPPPDLPVPTGRVSSVFPPLEPALASLSVESWVTARDWSSAANGLNGGFAFRPPPPRGWTG